MKTRLLAVLLAITILGGIALSADARVKERDVRDIVGSCHINGFYNFTDKDYLNEGADKLLELGTRVIKVTIAGSDRMPRYYPYNSDWTGIDTLVDVVKKPCFKTLFDKPFTTYVLMAFTPGKDIHYYTKGMTSEDKKREELSFYNLTKYLLTSYKGTGKTFVLQNWEGDWVLTPPQTTADPSQEAIQGMIDWLNARQAGVDRARREVGANGVTVVHAAEVNLLRKAMEGKPCVTNSVLPYTHCDLYSYSSYDTITRGMPLFRKSLDYMASKTPKSELYGKDDIYIGEFGWPESLVSEKERLAIVKGVVDTSLKRHLRYALFWELYDDGPKHPLNGKRPSNDDMIGNWLIRPDGTKSPVWDYFKDLFNGQG